MNFVRLGIVGVMAVSAMVTVAEAKTPKKAQAATAVAPGNIGMFNDWTAYAKGSGGKKVCYMTARPVKTQMPKGAGRGDVYLQIQHDQGRGVKNETYIVAGFTYDSKKPVEAVIDGKKYQLSPDKDAAWIFEPAAEKAFVAAMSRGNSMTVKQVSSRGTPVTDTYSLKGFGAAKKAIDGACAK